MNTPVLSIITVCYQAKEEVKKTITNVLQQTWKQFEYLVIDGASKDGTIQLLSNFKELFSEHGISYQYISEPDKGIYDAMNKGVRMAHGRWLLFLNAGDLLADSKILENVFCQSPTEQILYGDALCIYQGNQKRYPAMPLEHLYYEMSFCHQSAFIERSLLMEYPYNITYKVCADHHFFLSMYLKKKSFRYYPIPIAIYEIAGFSDQNKMLSHQEKHRMQKELGIFHFSLPWLFREYNFYLKQGIKSLFGQNLIDLVRKKRLR